MLVLTFVHVLCLVHAVGFALCSCTVLAVACSMVFAASAVANGILLGACHSTRQRRGAPAALADCINLYTTLHAPCPITLCCPAALLPASAAGQGSGTHTLHFMESVPLLSFFCEWDTHCLRCL